MKRFKQLFDIFITFFKIGATTFGGGYAMISIISEIVCDKKKWLTQDELLEICAISESTPGPIAINLATFVGFKKEKLLGSLFATLGVVIPSLVIIFIVSLIFDQFISNKYVEYCFIGIKSCVAFLILKTGIEMLLKQIKNNRSDKFKLILSLSIILIVFTLMIVLDILSITFSSIYLILVGGIIGIVAYSLNGGRK